MFLFVKQKTAYEMRIRDWSSDVCSSDLGALDAQTREGLQSELVDIHKRTGKTILFVTHDLDEAVLLANRIIVMRSGWLQEIIDIDLPRDRSDISSVERRVGKEWCRTIRLRRVPYHSKQKER